MHDIRILDVCNLDTFRFASAFSAPYMTVEELAVKGEIFSPSQGSIPLVFFRPIRLDIATYSGSNCSSVMAILAHSLSVLRTRSAFREVGDGYML